MASGLITVIILVIVGVAAFFLYRKYQKDKQFNKAFSDPIQIHDPGQGGAVVGSVPTSSFISPLTRKAIQG